MNEILFFLLGFFIGFFLSVFIFFYLIKRKIKKYLDNIEKIEDIKNLIEKFLKK